MSLKPVVFDCNHNNPIGNGNELAGFTALKNAGMVAGILKARQGINFGDPAYARRRHLMRSAGLLVGAYDFATHDVVADNVKDFLDFILPDPDGVLPFLDFEDNKASQMSGAQAKEFLDRVSQKFGFPCGIYGGNRIFEQITDNDPSWAEHPLWLCQYRVDPSLRFADLATLKQHIRIPPPWKEWFLLQFTGDGVGPQPHIMPGLENGADLNVFDGTAAELVARWLPTKSKVNPTVVAVQTAFGKVEAQPIPPTWPEIEAAVTAALPEESKS